MAAKGGAVLKLGMIAALLLASSGVGYYYAVYVPDREAQREAQRQLDQARADAARRAARLAADEQAQRQPALQQAAIETAYQACLTAAGAAHDASWAAACQRIADKALQDHADCLSKLDLPKTYCDVSYPARDGSAHCTLPDTIATVIEADLARARNRCLREREAAAGVR